ncbi:hypothetical protein L3X38_033157 [Prunus dulcis]|uniref:Uncharacterized protein n=1 Tax=Prunus dulcis TaxID=3755 RepID=A0AAD4YWP8_PRUDU|nr:hypothetical protein L3X38_033157 [Prunus dulcis]
MTSIGPSSIIRDHLYSTDDRLKRVRPPPLLRGADEDIIIDREPAPEETPVIDPASISRCCIEKGLFSTVPLFFQYPCGTSKGCSEWVDRELKNPSTCDILNWAGVLEAIFISKACDIHIEAKMPRPLLVLLYGSAIGFSFLGIVTEMSHVVLLCLYHYCSGDSSSVISPMTTCTRGCFRWPW